MFKKKINLYLLITLLLAGLLRIWKLNKVPVSLFADELDVGYQAYSIIHTGRDYFGNLLPLHFHSYADFRAPFYIYSAIPTVAISGISAWGVRLPAAIFGTLGVLGIYLLVEEILKIEKFKAINGRKLAFVSALVLTFSPWHIQYSRAAFEVTELLFFYLIGFYFFFKFLRSRKYLWASVLSFSITPWIYSTAKLFTSLIFIFLFLAWRKDLIKLSMRQKLNTIIIAGVLWLPLLYANLFGGASFRFNYISIFTNPTTPGEVQNLRLNDARVRERYGGGILQKVASRLIHNKYLFWSERIVDNYFKTASSEFLFVEGDPNLRHSINKIGQFYKIEAIALILGAIFFFVSKTGRKLKLLISFWIFAGIFPSALTRDGGNHATRLILILPPLIFLISFGIIDSIDKLKGKLKYIIVVLYLGFWLLDFGLYQHLYWIHNPWYSERSWHAGYKEAVLAAKKVEDDYGKIIFSNASDDPRIFLASYYPYYPQLWQNGMLEETVPGFGNIEHMGKFYFGQVDGEIGIDKISDFLAMDTLYIAASREIQGNLIRDPGKVPQGLKLVESVSYPSGEPAFYLFERSEK
ncbi:hypothetical protein A3H19_06500 [Candidatus Woesebacteria bacterium RIFCSPLOWO2_12_FULL_39_9]|nr:MAG: hypothetical protein A3H19_06500 [Candidatus Woesebacteria bacterium RIFCSPLOWO2_12_FULL_39_9]